MKDIRSIHGRAMELMRIASQNLEERDKESYLTNTKAALELEREAAFELLTNFDSEPTRSVLFRSAANLAYNLGQYEQAEKLIYQALAGSPHVEIKTELLNLKELIDTSFVRELSINDITEYNYITVIKANAVNLKVEPKNDKYSKAVVVDYIVDFLKNVQTSYKNFAEILFRKNFSQDDYRDFDGALTSFRKDSNLLMVDLNFQSFGVGLVADTEIMNYKYDMTEKFVNFKKTIFDGFKKDVLFADLNSEQFQQELANKYDDTERTKIYATIVTSLESKSDYKVSISDQNFKFKIKDLPTVSKKTQSFLKPRIVKADDVEKELLIKKTMELTDAEGNKRRKLQTEFLSYAEFSVNISHIKHKEDDIQIYFSEPYSIKIIFEGNTFSINDTFFDVYVENQDFKEIQKVYEVALSSKYIALSALSELTSDEQTILKNMKSTFLTS
jgi:tetratricopeptide (TPR) repeat protein